MALTPEGKVKNDIKKWLRAHGVWFFMPAANGYGTVGIPDIICCWRGTFVGIETKAPGKIGTVTPNQQMRLSEIRAAGGVAVVVDSVATLEVELAKERLDGSK